jgi:hypothetical protein
MHNDKLEERGCQGKREMFGEVTMKAVEEPKIMQASLSERSENHKKYSLPASAAIRSFY